MFRTIVIYIDRETGEILDIPRYDLGNWELTTLETKTIKLNATDYEKRIVKHARRSRQKRIDFID